MGTIFYKDEDINKEMLDSGHARPYFGQKKEAQVFDQRGIIRSKKTYSTFIPEMISLIKVVA